MPELLIVVGIIGLLTTIGLQQYVTYKMMQEPDFAQKRLSKMSAETARQWVIKHEVWAYKNQTIARKYLITFEQKFERIKKRDAEERAKRKLPPEQMIIIEENKMSMEYPYD